MKTRIALALALVAAAGYAAAETATPPPPAPHAPMHGTGPAASVTVGKIAKSTAADGRTVADVVSNKAALKDKSVTIRGQVVKVSSGILGKNWIHLQDGTGSAEKGNNDIVVTTTDETAIGQVVNATGTVRTDVAIGAGYKYAVLVEDAKLKK